MPETVWTCRQVLCHRALGHVRDTRPFRGHGHFTCRQQASSPLFRFVFVFSLLSLLLLGETPARGLSHAREECPEEKAICVLN